MRAKRKKTFRFNWQLVVVLFLGLVVLAGTLYGLRKWRRRYMATKALDAGLAAYEEGNWVEAAKALGRYCPVHPDDAAVLLKYADAQRHIVPQKESNIRQAVAAYRQVLRKDPTNTEAALNVSQIYIVGGLASDAEVILERLLKSAPEAGTPGHRWHIGAGDAKAGGLLAMALVRQRKFREADQLLEAVIEAVPGDIPAYELRASIKRQYPDELAGSPGRQVAEANEIIASAVKRNPASAAAHIALGAYLERIADSPAKKAEARAQYYEAVKCDFKDAATRVRLASIFTRIGDFDAAEKQLAAAEKAEPTMLSIWRARATLAKAKQSPSEADKVAENALEAMGEERFYFLPTAFDLFLYAGNRPKAKSCLDEIKTIDPQSTNIPFLDGMMAQNKGEIYKAIEYWKEAAQSADPVISVRAKIALGKAYNDINDLQAAVKVLRQLVGTLPKNGSMAGEAELALAQTLSRAQAWREAVDHCKTAVKLLPRNVEAHIAYLNVALHVAAVSSDRERALAGIADQVEKLRKQYPDDSRVAILYARIAQMQGKTDKVAEVARALEKDDATKMQGRLLDMELLWKRGQHEAAIERARDVVTDYPGDPAAVLVLAEVLTRDGDDAAAVKAIENGIDRADKEGRRDLQIALATFYRSHGDAARAEKVLTAVTREYPQDVTSRIMLLRVIGTGDPAKAQELIDEVKRIEGKQGTRWRYYQAMLWLSGDQWRSHAVEITNLLNANIEADPHDLASMILLGTAQEKAGNVRLAVETYRRAYEANPWSMPAAFRLIAALQTSGELEEAGKILDEAAKRGAKETSLASLRLGQYYREGNIDMAVETAGEMLKRDPNNPRLKVFVAGLKMRRKDFDGAHKLLDGMNASEGFVAAADVELLLREGKPDAALAVCDKLVASSKTAANYFFRGRVRAAVGKSDLALKDYDEGVRLAPDKPKSWLFLADFYVAHNNLAKATEAVEHALAVSPDYPPAVIRAAQLYWKNTDPKIREKGDQVLDNAIAAHPESPVNLLMLKARRLIEINTSASLKQARDILGRVTERSPGKVDAWALLARTALKAGLPDSALESIAKALAAHPSDAERRALLLLKAETESARWPALALATLKGLWEENRNDLGVGLALASAYRSAGETAKAIAVLEVLRGRVKAGPGLTSVDVALAQAVGATGDMKRAMKIARRAEAVAPGEPRVHIVIVGLLAEDAEWEAAAGEVAKWRQKYPADVTTPIMVADILMRLGQRLAAGTDATDKEKAYRSRELAQQILEGTLAAHPDDPRPMLALAVAYQSRGNLTKARDLYRRVLAKAPNSKIAINNLAWLLADSSSDLQEALILADRGRQRYPDFVELIDTRGIIYYRMGKIEDARKEFEEAVRRAPNAPAGAAARFHLARMLAEQNKKDQALRWIKGCRLSMLSSEDRARAEELLKDLTR